MSGSPSEVVIATRPFYSADPSLPLKGISMGRDPHRHFDSRTRSVPGRRP